ncbi:MAG: hypothetical protein LWW78_03520 [Deltaproteobacteria bacterium]|nr:hypothetical protein [Deltaproteobacteria bacterium]
MPLYNSKIWIRLITSSLVIFFAGRRLPEYARFFLSQPYKRTQLRHLVLNAIIFLPELSVITGAIVVAHDPKLALAGILGINLFNLFTLALLLSLNRGKEFDIHYTTVLSSIILTIVVCLGIWKGGVGILHVSWASLVLLVGYLFYTKVSMDVLSRHTEQELKIHIIYARLFIASLLIFAVGGPLAYACHEMATAFKLNTSLVGGFLLAAITCSPRIATLSSQMREGKLSESINTTLHSSIFTLGILVFLADLFYAKAPLFVEATNIHLWLALEGILLMAISYLILIYKRPTFSPLLIITIYITSFLIFLYKAL